MITEKKKKKRSIKILTIMSFVAENKKLHIEIYVDILTYAYTQTYARSLVRGQKNEEIQERKTPHRL